MGFKQVIIVNKEFKMPPGKMAAQVAHASCHAIITMMNKDVYEGNPMKIEQYRNPYWHTNFYNWIKQGYPKIILQCKTENELKEIFRKAIKEKLPSYIVYDEGRTVLKGRHYTTCAIGPWKNKEIQNITGELKLY